MCHPNVYLSAGGVNDDVRSELHRITTEVVGLERMAEQAEAVLDVARVNGLRIQLVECADPSSEFNCFRHALALRELPVAVVDMCAMCETGLKSDFVRKLIEKCLTRRTGADVQEGDLVIYRNRDTITHAGIVRSGMVESKWGTGHIWRHHVFEVPSVYGERVEFFEPLPPEAVLKEFVAHLEAEFGDAEQELTDPEPSPE